MKPNSLNSPPHLHRSRRFVAFALLALVACMVLVVALWPKNTSTKALPRIQPPHLGAAPFSERKVIGDLGGVPVVIPGHFANHVEYEGDPGWGGAAQPAPRAVRTEASKLISFGFEVRFPDMAGLSSPALEADKRAQTIYNTMWIDVGINTGKIYPGTGFLDRRSTYVNEAGRQFQYEKVPSTQDDLTLYVPSGIDPKTQRPFRANRDAKDVFLHRDTNGRVDAYISCSNRLHEAAACRHDFSIEPFMKAQVYVTYRRGLLPNWQQIQSSVTQLVTGFKAQGSSSDATKR